MASTTSTSSKTTKTTTTSTSSSAITALGPLTTVFTPSSSCTVDLYRSNYAGVTCLYGTSTIACQFYHVGMATSTSDCLPSGWSDDVGAYFSPGLCPQGYSQVDPSTVTLSGVAETRAVCCPSGFVRQTSTYWPWYTTDLCTSTMTSSELFVFTTSIIGEGWQSSSTTGAEGFNAFGVSIRYKATDFASTSATATSGGSSTDTGTSSSTTTGSGTTTGTDAASSSTASSTASSGLSAGAKAGIGIGVAVGALVLLGALAYAILRRRRQHQNVVRVAAGHTSLPPADPYAYAVPPEQKYVQAPVAEAPADMMWPQRPTELAEMPYQR